MENSKFKVLAREQQIKFREKYIGNEYNTYKTWLSIRDSMDGKNFFTGFKEDNGFEIFDVVRSCIYPIKNDSDFLNRKKINVYSDMLRSEHIPINLFVPLMFDLDYCKNIFNEFLNGTIKEISKRSILDNKENIRIEFAPSPKEEYLNDRTSFDTYMEYVHNDGCLGLICIEVKYTEKDYPLKKGSKEEKDVNNNLSKYYEISNKSNLYKLNSNGYSMEPKENKLKENRYRQIWRNQLLAESILLRNGENIKHATSIIIYPENNTHFSIIGKNYINMLNDKNKFALITYENYIKSCYKHCPDDEHKNWIDYLSNRYIV
jgi:hypothetical protein